MQDLEVLRMLHKMNQKSFRGRVRSTVPSTCLATSLHVFAKMLQLQQAHARILN